MKELIEKIQVNESLVKEKLEWLSQRKDHALYSEGNTELIRYLLKKVVDLEEKLELLTK